MTLSKRWTIVIVLGLGGAVSYVAIHYSHRRGTSVCASFLTGDTHRGGQLFYSYGCNACHPLYGQGAAAAPDLARLQPQGWRPVLAVAAMWSHGPGMWQKFKDARMGLPLMREADVLDLFAFLGSLEYMDESGDPDKGHDLFVEKGCAGCHATQGTAHKTGPDLTQLDVETPILWAQRMWNHSDVMSALLNKKGLPWPTFEGNEMVDLLAYTRSISHATRTEWRLLPADPAAGQRLFTTKGCVVCHAVNGRGGKVGPSLGPDHPESPTMIQFAGLMWNHAPQMWEKIRAQGVARPKFAEKEMADLIAFLYQVRYFEPQGDSRAGQRVFESKGCPVCHGSSGSGGNGGPDLHETSYCASTMAYAFWAHGPKMYAKMQAASISWPTFNEEEMANLIAFLNSR